MKKNNTWYYYALFCSAIFWLLTGCEVGNPAQQHDARVIRPTPIDIDRTPTPTPLPTILPTSTVPTPPSVDPTTYKATLYTDPEEGGYAPLTVNFRIEITEVSLMPSPPGGLRSYNGNNMSISRQADSDVYFPGSMTTVDHYEWTFSDSAFLTTMEPYASHIFSVPGTHHASCLLKMTDGREWLVTGTDFPVKEVPVPVILPETPWFTNPPTITITCTEPTAVIWYTLDGNNPFENGITYRYTQPFSINKSCTVKAISVVPVNKDSAIAARSYQYFPTNYRKIAEFGGPGYWGFPVFIDGLAMSPVTGNILVPVTNYSHSMYTGIHRFNMSGGYLGKWGGLGTGNGLFEQLGSVTVDKYGYVYVADTMGKNIQKFTETGTFIAKWGGSGTGNGQFMSIDAITLDKTSNILYVYDETAQMIQKFSTGGTFIGKWSVNYIPETPTFNSIALDSHNNLYSSYFAPCRVNVYSPAGNLTQVWNGYPGGGEGVICYPVGIAVDSLDKVYLADTCKMTIQMFTASRQYLGKIQLNSNTSPLHLALYQDKVFTLINTSVNDQLIYKIFGFEPLPN